MSSFSEDDAFEAAAVPLSQRAMMRPAAPYLDGLNPAQREAVEKLDGPVLMLAGAGTGKTKALTTRIAHLLITGTARPHEILAVTFTNKAAREMKSRIGGMLGEAVEGMPWLGTFHAVCVKQLRRHAELVGLKSNFTILDTDDQIRLMKQLIEAAGIDHKRWPARMLSGIIDGWKNKAWTPENVPVSESGAFDHKGVDLYAAYQRRLLELNAVDFGDILLHMVTIFQKHPDVLDQYQRWFRYILVDEYQDTNVAQYMWLRLLASAHKNICCVGDDDQSIYGWRGAEVGNILRFEKDFPGAHVVRLEENYRSTGHILAAASGVISANKGRLGKTLFTSGEDGEKVRLIGHWDGEEEARWIGEEIEAMQHGTRGMEPIGLDQMAIMVRSTQQMRSFEDRFMAIGLPYRVVGGPRFYERKEIRDAIAYLRLALSPEQDLAFDRIFNTPKRGLGDKAYQTIQATARSNGVSLVEGARLVCQGRLLSGKGLKELKTLVASIDRWHAQAMAEPDTHVELAEIVLDESGYTGSFFLPQSDAEIASGARPILKDVDAEGRLENLKELIVQLDRFDNLAGFLEHVSLSVDGFESDDVQKVSIMTLHAAKGLEFDAVLLPGWEDGLFPSQRSMDETGLKGLEEERRLAYVGLTRAAKCCIISFASNRLIFSKDNRGWTSQMPSRFIDELPEDHVEVLTPPGLYGGGYGAAGMSASASPAMSGMVGSTLHEEAHKADVYNSPGWRRLQARSQQRGVAAPAEARNMTIDLDAVSAFTEGERVFHQKFGYGEIMGIEGDKLVIEFDKAGSKHVVAKFVVSADQANDVPF